MSRKTILAIVLVLVVLAAVLAIAGRPLARSALFLALIGGLQVVVFAVVHLVRRHFHVIERRRFLKNHPNWDADPLAARLGTEWARTLRVPRTEFVLDAAPCTESWRLICFGVPELPKFEPAPDEPTIITPTERTAYLLSHTAGSVAIIFFVWALSQTGLFGFPAFLVGGRMVGTALVAGVVVLIWAWRAGLRPVYIRLAPRMIQFLHYTVRSRPPTISSYPAAGGTIVIAESSGKLTFTAAAQRDIWNPVAAVLAAPPLAMVLAALNAQRSTPPLSEDELVG